MFFSELVCNAKFSSSSFDQQGGSYDLQGGRYDQQQELSCDGPVSSLPIATTTGDKCVGDLSYFGWSIGPHDARVFYGPQGPWTVFGSVSGKTCFGMWMQDFRVLVDWGLELANLSATSVQPIQPKESGKVGDWRIAKELQRPPPYGNIEKNWFAFWDREGVMYIHHDIAPKRVFAKLQIDGSVGPDLAPAADDAKCMEALMPKVSVGPESIHQATNSLAITMCKRADEACKREGNTYVMMIFHHKTFYEWHGVYEPYVMLFEEVAPFAVHGIGRKPLWVSGRGAPGKGKIPEGYPEERVGGWNQTEMLFTTSISWKAKGQKYHGYLDDIMFVGFGIEDADTGAIDVVAGDLLKDLALCSGV